ncbi:Pex14p NDAI_0H03410 [Naumovozyma dairenensis CBS 421]|uniref:Peroxisomal membrane protein PEX14 n=1 Tax=Naumovozyma dairenensis (strain ATCC 10597 / BCRC 20456 / CBS 421 / NBRC 0211 / NRRL Y-12639) TaxID=1071378 RepID=G0WFF3_NAUDC|nr:hypothetical protein NDAI_0H03410 [Naumovozyma dairenensis CBS 421]CCD26514.1 hypothetical protein NDAI_0H03410 [Naumovozyma dairenensis CBS 421]
MGSETTITSESSRRDLYSSAVSFLKDSSVKDAPLSKKIEFLQNKGLNNDEIELALRDSRDSNGIPLSVGNDIGRRKRNENDDEGNSSSSYYYEAIPPPIPRRDWKDYFVMATATAGIAYGVYELTRRYVLPNILPESKTKLEQDKEEIKNQFNRVDKVLNAIEQEQAEFKEHEEAKMNELDDVIRDLNMTVDRTTEMRTKMEDEFRMLKLEMSNLQNTIDKFIKDNGNSSQVDQINTEIESLKNLIRNSSNLPQELNASPSLGDNKKSPSTGIPGMDAIPSTAELLAKMNFPNDYLPTSNHIQQENGINKAVSNENSIPAWKRNREELNIDSTGESTPEWQKHTTPKPVDVPNWQTALEGAEHQDTDEEKEKQ